MPSIETHAQMLKKTAKASSRYPFIAAHRGGPLTRENHRQLMQLARKCSEHVLSLPGAEVDKRLVHALHVAEEWENDRVPTGDATKASLGAHAVARESSTPVAIAVARSVGHAVATAHMADHAMGAALYALRAVQHAGKSVEEESAWQHEQLQSLPPEIARLVQTTMANKSKSFK
jgi:hypothetical protein